MSVHPDDQRKWLWMISAIPLIRLMYLQDNKNVNGDWLVELDSFPIQWGLCAHFQTFTFIPNSSSSNI